MSKLKESQAWKALAAHAKENHRISGGPVFTLEGVQFDFTKVLASKKTFDLLNAFAEQQDVTGKLRQMMAGAKINISEDQAAWHTVLRASDAPAEVKETFVRMKNCAERIRAEKKIKKIIHIGIGGSDLGPRLVCQALGQGDGPQVHFSAALGCDDFEDFLKTLNPAETLVITASKSFTTPETLIEFNAAKSWLGAHAQNLIAVTAKPDEAKKSGVTAENIFPFWNWVGGRFSVWSSVGLPIALKFGFDVFEKFLSGARAVDQHVANTPIAQNIPALMALIDVWYVSFLNFRAHAILPYSQRLAALPDYLRQLEMESNGKGVDIKGTPVDYQTCPVIFGDVGLNAQHAFMQMLHQGPETIPVDFIGVQDTKNHMAIASMEAQAQALMEGGGKGHAYCPGNRPSTAILLPHTDAYSMGVLMAVYEHKTAIQGFLWQINSFDQFGVQLGKALTKERLAR